MGLFGKASYRRASWAYPLEYERLLGISRHLAPRRVGIHSLVSFGPGSVSVGIRPAPKFLASGLYSRPLWIATLGSCKSPRGATHHYLSRVLPLWVPYIFADT